MPKRRAHGEGALFKREYIRTGGKQVTRYVAELDVEPGPDGRRKRWRATFTKERDARDALQEQLAKQRQGLPVVVEKQTVREFLAGWLRDVARPPTVSPNTHRNYRTDVEKHLVPQLGHHELAKLAPQHIQACLTVLTEQGLSPKTVRNVHGVLHAALHQALEWGLIPRNPADPVKLPRTERYEATFLTPEEAARFLVVARRHRLAAYWTVAVALGLRPSEALGLRWTDLDLERAQLRVVNQLQQVDGEWRLVELKTRTGRRVLDLPAFAVAALAVRRAQQLAEQHQAGKLWRNTLGLVFTTRSGTPLDRRNVAHYFQALREAAGLPAARLYDLRHTAASLLIAQGAHPREVAGILGHAKTTMTMDIYGHIFPGRTRELAAKLDALLGECPPNAREVLTACGKAADEAQNVGSDKASDPTGSGQ